QQALSAYEWLDDEQVRSVNCVYGMKPNPDTVPSLQRQPTYAQWLEAVRAFQRLNTSGRYRIAFFLNVAPPVCPDGAVFSDGGTAAVNAFSMKVFSDGAPAVSAYDAFRHVRPSQMPAAASHALGNSNDVKAQVLFGFLRDQILPALVPRRST